ncbi:MarR family transcriptional regulator [Ramlibacter sp. MAH-25]|uniref:MarR family transcriptional regulator n=1 Tax=Ramlibacter pinisoli TaxID=2682844 RepID=A0A6N8IP18_9BURK|nr:MarR family transcriptional regulator [Ramlibacter sp. CGMCC 1.13660]MVQ28305.1 MarR family transcriptional regulator [Ramlibacter pinisoli]
MPGPATSTEPPVVARHAAVPVIVAGQPAGNGARQGTIHAIHRHPVPHILSPHAVAAPNSTTRNPPTSLSRLYARPGFLLRRAHQISAAVFEEECRPVQLTPAQFGVLTVLQARPGMGQSSLARALGFDKVTVLRVLRGLEARGLVDRQAAEGKRNVSVVLTDAGAALLAEAQRPAERAYRRLMAPLDRAQQEQLLGLLQLLTGELEDQARAAFVRPDDLAA